jgi:phosphate transport system substrate-binding protein
MTDEQLAGAKGGPIMHIPTVLGAVAIIYNVPGVSAPLKFTGDVLADVFLGKITKWNDSRISALNPGAKLPAQDIVVTHRSDGSGTTYIFTDYLSVANQGWASGPGKSQTISWPVGLGGKGSEGVSGLVRQTPGAIGYVELSYAKQNKLQTALIRNPAGEWSAPTIEGVTAAAAGSAAKLPANTDYRISIVNAPGKGAYPISSFTWIILYTTPKDAAKSKKLVDFIRWALHDGEKAAPSLDYAPLPASMVKMLDSKLSEIKVASR